MYDLRKKRLRSIWPLLLLCFWLAPTPFIHAMEVELEWQTLSPVNAAGEATLAIVSSPPATLTAYDIYVTYDPSRIELTDVQIGGEDAPNSNHTNVDGTLFMQAQCKDGSVLGAGDAYTFATIKIKIKGKDPATIALARSTFIDADGDELNGTMMLIHDLPAPGSLPSPSPTQTTASQKSSAIQSSPASSNGVVSAQTSVDPSSAAASENQTADHSRRLKLGLASASLLLLVFIIYLLYRNNKRR